MPITVKPLAAPFGAEIVGVEVARGVDAADAGAIADALGEYGVLVMRGPIPDDADFVRFGDALGEVAANTGPYGKNQGSPITRITNLDAGGALPDADTPDVFSANELWHTDGSYAEPWTVVSLLAAHIVPSVGGDTSYCDTRRAYERLSRDRQAEVATLTTEHSLVHSRLLTGFGGWTEERKAELPAVERPLARRHEPSGRTALCLASHICAVSGMAYDEGQAYIGELVDGATEPGEVYTHQWDVGDIVMWDNRCTMHRGHPYERLRDARDLHTLRLYELGRGAI